MAVVRSRCRQTYRVVWEPARQVFPAIDRNSFRNRISKLLPGNEGYAQRLENAWHELWAKHRGTPLLSDDDPTNILNFDLAEHVTFLRKNINKESLLVCASFIYAGCHLMCFLHRRAGLVPEVVEGGPPSHNLPVNLQSLGQLFDIHDRGLSIINYDFMSDVLVDETRERMFSGEAFTLSSDNWGDDDALEPANFEVIGKTKAMIKVCFGLMPF